MELDEIMRQLRKELDAMKKANQKLVKEVELSDGDLLEMIEIYEDWEKVAEGTLLKNKEYFSYKGSLYQVIDGKEHNKQIDRKPTVKSLFNKVMPAGVIPEWVQPTGGHDAYNVGDRVTYRGKDYISKIDANTTIPDGDTPHNRWWSEVNV